MNTHETNNSVNINCKKSQIKKAEHVAVVGVIAAFAAILSYIESIISFSIWIPGVKLGLANMAIVTVLYLYSSREALAVNFVRILVVGLLFGNMFSVLFSIAGAIISFLVMVLLKKSNLFTVIGVSVAGGAAHNIGQILVASIVVETYGVLYYLPALIIAGIITGFIIGIVAAMLIKYMTVLLKKKGLV